MNEERLPQWARMQLSNTGSPRRVAVQFDEEHQRSRMMICDGNSNDTTCGNNVFVSSCEFRRIQSELVEHYLDDNLLSIYCRQGLWDQALERCETHIHEAIPTTTILSKSDFFEGMEETWSCVLQQSKVHDKPTIYQPTPLGILCGSSDLNHGFPETLKALVVALCQTREPQVSANQNMVGNTPLRQAIRNPICPPVVIETLLKQSDAIAALQQPDEHGIYPLDLMLQRVRGQVSHEVGESLLQSFLSHAPLQQLSQSLDYSPLVRFYATVVNRYSGLQQSWRHQLSVPTFGGRSIASSRHDDTVVWVTRMLLDAMPSLLTASSAITGCMPIHAALRNHGSTADLIEVLLAYQNNNNNNNNNNTHNDRPWRCMLHRNHFGDLPLHIASACGVPLPVLRLVLARTVQAAAKTHHEAPTVLWSTNHAGYTPIDLEWVRHIEAGNGFLSQSVYQPIGVEGIPRPRGRYDDLYDKLLRQAVDQLISTSKMTVRQRTMGTMPSQDIFGLLLHRIFLITRATFHDSFSQSPFDLSGDILHQAAALFQPRGPSMPEAIMDLLLWQYPEQIQQRDHLGRTPLHHAVHVYTPPCMEISERKSVAWGRWVRKLLVESHAAAAKTDHRGRYPLHAALEAYHTDDVDDNIINENNSSTLVPCDEFHNIVVELSKAFPEALHICDPVSHLFPAMQAACHPLVPLDTVYWLLSRAPKVLF